MYIIYATTFAVNEVVYVWKASIHHREVYMG